MTLAKEKYRLRNGDDIGDPRVLNTRLFDLDLRMHKQEEIEKDWVAALDELQRVGLSRIDEVLLPVFNKIHDLAQLGAMFTAHSATELEISPGLKRFTVNEDERELFAPAAYVAAFVDGDLSKAMLGTVLSYDIGSGELEVVVDRVAGDSTGANWVIHAASATDNAEAAEIAEAAKAVCVETRDAMLILRDYVDQKHAETNNFRDAASQSAGIASGKATDAGLARDQAVDARDATIAAAANGVAAIAAAYAAWDEYFLGPFASSPATGFGGSPLAVGQLYFNTTSEIMMVYTSGGWVAAVVPVGSEVTQVFGRTGAVGAVAGDYNAGQITFTPAGTLAATNVQAALEEAAADAAAALSSGLATKASASHTHAIAEVASLQAALDGLQAAVDGKAPLSHNHPWSQVTAAPTTLAGYGITDALAAAAYTAADVLAKMKSVDGAGSGLDADLLDGLQGASYALADASNMGARLGIFARNPGSLDWNTVKENGWYMGTSTTNSPTGDTRWFIGIITAHNASWVTQVLWDFANDRKTYRRDCRNGTWQAWVQIAATDGKVWHPDNHGTGSGLDADKLDGLHASEFAAVSHTHDNRYYTETEVDSLLAGKANVVHSHDGAYLPVGGKAADADKLDNMEPSTAATPNTIVQRDAAGHVTGNYLFGGYAAMSHGVNTRNADTIFYSSTDNYIRKNFATGFRTSLSVYSKAEVDALLASVGNYAESSALAYAVNVETAFAHGLGKMPDKFGCYLVAKTTTFGYAVGDRVKFDSGNYALGSWIGMVRVKATPTEVSLLFRQAPVVLYGNSISFAPVSATDFDVILWAEA